MGREMCIRDRYDPLTAGHIDKKTVTLVGSDFVLDKNSDIKRLLKNKGCLLYTSIPFIELRRLYQTDKIQNQYQALGSVLGISFCLLYTS